MADGVTIFGIIRRIVLIGSRLRIVESCVSEHLVLRCVVSNSVILDMDIVFLRSWRLFCLWSANRCSVACGVVRQGCILVVGTPSRI